MRSISPNDSLLVGGVSGLHAHGLRPGALTGEEEEVDISRVALARESTAATPGKPWSINILVALSERFGRDFVTLAKLATVAGGDAQLLARVEETFGQLAMICGVVAVEEGLVAALDDEAGNVHDEQRRSRERAR